MFSRLASSSTTQRPPALRIVRNTACISVVGGRLVIIIDSEVLHSYTQSTPIKAFRPPSEYHHAEPPPGRPRTHAHQTAPAAITLPPPRPGPVTCAHHNTPTPLPLPCLLTNTAAAPSTTSRPRSCYHPNHSNAKPYLKFSRYLGGHQVDYYTF